MFIARPEVDIQTSHCVNRFQHKTRELVLKTGNFFSPHSELDGALKLVFSVDWALKARQYMENLIPLPPNFLRILVFSRTMLTKIENIRFSSGKSVEIRKLRKSRILQTPYSPHSELDLGFKLVGMLCRLGSKSKTVNEKFILPLLP